MEIKKTTVISALVCIAGILTEIIFCDIMSKSVSGLVLSIILAVVILASAYFVIDGIRTFWMLEQEKTTEKEKEYEQRLYEVLNEQLRFQKEIYRKVYSSSQGAEELFDEGEPETPTEKSEEELIEAINGNTMKAAKTVARYINKNTNEIKDLLEEKQEGAAEALKRIESNQESILELLEELQNAQK